MDDKKAKVYRIFESLADGYDAANDRISLGLQKSWKRMLTQSVMKKAKATHPVRFLDVCCGTGDIAIMLAKEAPHAAVTGVDFSPAMLAVAKEKSKQFDNLTWSCADAADLPFEDNVFQAATISFGLEEHHAGVQFRNIHYWIYLGYHGNRLLGTPADTHEYARQNGH